MCMTAVAGWGCPSEGCQILIPWCLEGPGSGAGWSGARPPRPSPPAPLLLLPLWPPGRGPPGSVARLGEGVRSRGLSLSKHTGGMMEDFTGLTECNLVDCQPGAPPLADRRGRGWTDRSRSERDRGTWRRMDGPTDRERQREREAGRQSERQAGRQGWV